MIFETFTNPSVVYISHICEILHKCKSTFDKEFNKRSKKLDILIDDDISKIREYGIKSINECIEKINSYSIDDYKKMDEDGFQSIVESVEKTIAYIDFLITQLNPPKKDRISI